MRSVVSEKEMRHAPKDRESISCEDLYFVKNCASVIRTMTQTIVTALVRFVNPGDGGLVNERSTFVSRGVNLRLMHRPSNRRFLWSRFIRDGIIPGVDHFGDIGGSDGAVIPLARGELSDQR